jgi:hypothetical protein
MRNSVTWKKKFLKTSCIYYSRESRKEDKIMLWADMITLGEKTLKTHLKNPLCDFSLLHQLAKQKRWIRSKAKLIKLIALWSPVQNAIPVSCSLSGDMT